jgi:hypothetical protein
MRSLVEAHSLAPLHASRWGVPGRHAHAYTQSTHARMHAPTHATKRENGADSRKTGALDQKQFNVAMALVALAQSAYALIAVAPNVVPCCIAAMVASAVGVCKCRAAPRAAAHVPLVRGSQQKAMHRLGCGLRRSAAGGASCRVPLCLQSLLQHAVHRC